MILGPHRRSKVSSTAKSSGIPALCSPIIRPSSNLLNNNGCQRFRFNTRWYFSNRGSSSSPITRKADVTVRRPGVKMAPNSNTKPFFQVGAVNAMANTLSNSTISGLGFFLASGFNTHIERAFIIHILRISSLFPQFFFIKNGQN